MAITHTAALDLVRGCEEELVAQKTALIALIVPDKKLEQMRVLVDGELDAAIDGLASVGYLLEEAQKVARAAAKVVPAAKPVAKAAPANGKGSKPAAQTRGGARKVSKAAAQDKAVIEAAEQIAAGAAEVEVPA